MKKGGKSFKRAQTLKALRLFNISVNLTVSSTYRGGKHVVVKPNPQISQYLSGQRRLNCLSSVLVSLVTMERTLCGLSSVGECFSLSGHKPESATAFNDFHLNSIVINLFV